MPADPKAAGRKGGSSRSEKKLAACRRNGFQKVTPAPAPSPAPDTEPRTERTFTPVLFTANPNKETR
jgi:hypothetical protein